MEIGMNQINSNILELRRDVELTDCAKQELAIARASPESELISLEEAKKKILSKK